VVGTREGSAYEIGRRYLGSTEQINISCLEVVQDVGRGVTKSMNFVSVTGLF
jgi:hypothetical protein